MARPITARIAADLIDKVFKAEGWTKVEGEARVARVKAVYDLSLDHRAGKYLATRKPQRQP